MPTGDQKGSTNNPVNMAFVPSADSQKVLASGEPLANLLTQATNLNFKVSVPTSYTTVIEAMGSGQVDVGWLAPFAYVLAHDRNGSQDRGPKRDDISDLRVEPHCIQADDQRARYDRDAHLAHQVSHRPAVRCEEPPQGSAVQVLAEPEGDQQRRR